MISCLQSHYMTDDQIRWVCGFISNIVMIEHKDRFEQLHRVCFTAMLAIQDQLQTIKEFIYTYIYIIYINLNLGQHIIYLTDLISRYACHASIINYNHMDFIDPHAARMPNPQRFRVPEGICSRFVIHGWLRACSQVIRFSGSFCNNLETKS